MRKIVSMTSVVALLLAVAARGGDGKAVMPGPEHKKFKELEGTWDAKCEFMGKNSEGTAHYQVGLGGLWLFEHFKGEFDGKKFEGKGATTYDPASKKYINIWIDSMSTTPMISKGSYEKNKLVLKGKSTHDGKVMDVTMISEMKDQNTMIFTMSATEGGKQQEMMKITYTRKKAGRGE